MCVGGGGSAPAAPEAPKPPAEVKTPDTPTVAAQQRKARAAATGMAAGSGSMSTLLTGPGGIQPGALNVAKPSLLGM